MTWRNFWSFWMQVKWESLAQIWNLFSVFKVDVQKLEWMKRLKVGRSVETLSSTLTQVSTQISDHLSFKHPLKEWRGFSTLKFSFQVCLTVYCFLLTIKRVELKTLPEPAPSKSFNPTAASTLSRLPQKPRRNTSRANLKAKKVLSKQKAS